jgi:hypothetical protein
MHFISSGKQKSANSAIFVRYVTDNLFSAKLDWKLRTGPVAQNAANPCIFICEVIHLSGSGVQITPNAEHLLN